MRACERAWWPDRSGSIGSSLTRTSLKVTIRSSRRETTQMTTETIRAHNDSIRRTGPWTTARRFDVRASSSSVVLDLLLPEIPDGEIEIAIDLNRSTLKLLVPDGSRIDADDLRRVGRGRVKDWTGTAAPDGRRIRIVGEMRGSEVRI